MFYLYILKLSDGTFYKGQTHDIDVRLNEHQFSLLHVEICENREDARKLEKFFKSGYGREIIQNISGRVAER